MDIDRGQIPEDVLARSDDILCEAMGIEEVTERQAFIECACAGDEAVRRRVTYLLSFEKEADTLFGSGTASQVSATELVNTLTGFPDFSEGGPICFLDDDEVGKQIGHYTLLRKIGEGGAGNVYLAEQSRPVRRHVALKILKAGMDTRSVIARFEAERQALAMMDHPNIAHVFNAGETESGRPYFVMELVSGERITRYCDEHRLSIQDRLKLFVQVCSAIQHAHQKGIVHRDIKPSNVLIASHDGVPRPVVIDFGIAKATHGDVLTEKTFHTSADHWIGTPAYMSPEQVDCRHSDIDTRSDIYSLGALLYELMLGEPPFDQKELLRGGLEKMRHTLLEREPQRPSSRLLQMSAEEQRRMSGLRATEMRRLCAELSGDLDWVVLKALEKDRSRRYETVDALAVDIEHYLRIEPVVARPPGRGYRFLKLVRRNKMAAASVAAVSVSLLIGLSGMSWLFVKERAARQLAVAATRVATEAEREQTRLRKEAEDRERITQAAYLISLGQLDDAYAEVRVITTELRPSLETGSVLRTLAEWLALREEWNEAVRFFKLLLDVDVRDNSLDLTGDLLMAGPLLVEHEGLSNYEAFRRAAVERCRGTDSPVAAERVIKISLLFPAEMELMDQLKPFAVVASDDSRELDDGQIPAWRCVSLALWHLRNEDAPGAVEWAQKSITFADYNEVRDATAHIIQAMALNRMGRAEEALSHLEAGRSIVSARLSGGLQKGSPRSGFWFDLLFARILLNEATPLIEPAAETSL